MTPSSPETLFVSRRECSLRQAPMVVEPRLTRTLQLHSWGVETVVDLWERAISIAEDALGSAHPQVAQYLLR